MANKMGFSLTQIEYALAVHKHGHFAKAAEACNVTQPTLSMQIQKLEDELGVVLFDRSKKPILLTAAGSRLIEQFQTIVFEAKKIKTLLEGSDEDRTRGLLHLGVIPTIAPYVLPRLLPTIEKMHPELELEIFEMQTKDIISALNSDEIDVGLLAIPLELPQIQEHALYYEPFQVLCKKGHELGKGKTVHHADLKSSDVWLLPEGHCLRNQVLDICSPRPKKSSGRNFRFESGSLDTLKSLVDSYGGYTLLPTLATDGIGKNSQLVSFTRPIPAREIGLVYQRKQYKTDLIEALAEAILAAIPESIRKLRQRDLDILPID